MIQSYQLGDFKYSSKQVYDQIVSSQQTINIYIYKEGFPNILVRAPNAVKKIHCWRLKTIQVTQYESEQGARQKAVALVKFDGQLIFTLIEMFNQMMGKQILEYVENITNQLREWCSAPITNIFKVSQKSQQSFGYKHAFLKVTPLLKHLHRYYFYQCRTWTASLDSDIKEIQISQNVMQGKSNYENIFDDIYNLLRQQKIMYMQMKQKKRRKQQQKRIEELKQKGIEPNSDYNQYQFQQSVSIGFADQNSNEGKFSFQQ